MNHRIGAISISFLALLVMYIFPTENRGPLLMCGAVWLFFLPKKNEQEVYTYKVLQYTALQESVYAKDISLFVALGVLSKVWFFPFLFAVYVFFLFIQQTHLFDLHFSWLFLLFDEGLHLFFLLVSVFFMSTVTEQTYKKYITPVRSALRGVCCIVLVGVVACLSVWIVWQATISLGWIAHVVSSLTGCCVVLLGFLLFGTKDEEIAE